MIISGVIFENSRKKNEKQPDLNITIELDGVKHRVGGWKRRSKKDNSVFFSIYGDTSKTPPEKGDIDTVLTDNNLSDDIPF